MKDPPEIGCSVALMLPQEMSLFVEAWQVYGVAQKCVVPVPIAQSLPVGAAGMI